MDVGCSNMNAYSFITFYTDMLQQNITLVAQPTIDKWPLMEENLSSGVCAQQRRKPDCVDAQDCADAQSDQRLCYSLFVKYHI